MTNRWWIWHIGSDDSSPISYQTVILSTIISDSTCVYMLNTTHKCLDFQVYRSVLLRGLLHLHLKRNLVENTIRGKWCNFTFMHTKVNPHHETKRIFFEIQVSESLVREALMSNCEATPDSSFYYWEYPMFTTMM